METIAADRLMIDTKELAYQLSVSEKWVKNNRYRIIGALKIGGMWRFDVEKIRRCIATGKDLIVK